MRRLVIFSLIVLLSDCLYAVNVLPERYFRLDPPMSEGASTRSHPWILNFGNAEISHTHEEPSFIVKPSKPSVQLTFDRKLPKEQLVLATLKIRVEPTEEELELFDFAGALLGVVQTESGPKLRFTSYDEATNDWTWFEGDMELPIDDRMVNLDIAVVVDRSVGKWAFRVGNSIFDNLSLLPASIVEGEEDASLYILGNERTELRIQKLVIEEVRLVNGRAHLQYDALLRYRAAMETTQERPSQRTELKRSVERRRLILLDWSFAFIDQNGQPMPKVTLDDGSELTVYSGGGPQPTYIELEAFIQADVASDKRFVIWDLFESDWDKSYSRLLASGSFKDESKVKIPLTPDEKGNLPTSFQIRIYIDTD